MSRRHKHNVRRINIIKCYVTDSVVAIHYNISFYCLICLVFSGHKKRKEVNGQIITVCKYTKMTNAGEANCTVVSLKHAVIPVVIRCLNERFVSYDQQIFKSMQWIDPANWTSDDSEDLAAIQVNMLLKYQNFIKHL